MNYVLINSGLGNQMFQYAFYLGLKAKGLRVQPLLSSKRTGHCGYELERVFDIRMPIGGGSLWTFLFSLPRGTGLTGRLFRWMYETYPVKHYQFEPEILARSWHRLCFDGYWQTEQYFMHCEPTVRKAFAFSPAKMNEQTLRLAEVIRRNNAVSVHVRRGDYQSEGFKNTLGKCCPKEYYERAMERICQQVPHPHFVFFSDDMEWVRSNLGMTDALYVTHNRGRDSWQDMYLMSQCKHNVIANSSFSWWGAWLNENPAKVVVAPACWWGDRRCADVVPPSWTRI